MRVALLALVLWLACAPLSAQTDREPKKAPAKGHTVGKDSQPPKGQPSPAAKMQREQEEKRRRAQKQEKPKNDPARPQDQRARERTSSDPAPKHGGHTVSRDSEPPKGQPSPAARMQQQQSQQFQQRVTGEPPPRVSSPPSRTQRPPRQPMLDDPAQPQDQQPSLQQPPLQQGPVQQRSVQQRAVSDPDGGVERRTVQCRARPVCGGSYGACQEVVEVYTSATPGASRRDIVRQCVEANTPDTCRCAPQCERVAQCSIF